MGDPKRIRKKYDTPSHPWVKVRIEEEKRLAREFGTNNKKEIWKMETILKGFKSQAKKLISLQTDQAKVEKDHLFRRMQQLGLILDDVSFDKILGLKIDDLMKRRLQSVIYQKGMAKSVKQARQFIVHAHVLVEGKKITSPSYLVSKKEEASVSFALGSSLFSEDHPERATVDRIAELRAAKEAEAKKIAEAEAKRLAQEEKEKAEGVENVVPEEDESADDEQKSDEPNVVKGDEQ